MGAAPKGPVYGREFETGIVGARRSNQAPAGMKPIPLPAGLSAAPDLTEVAVRAARQAASLRLTAGKGRASAFGAPITPPKTLLGG